MPCFGSERGAASLLPRSPWTTRTWLFPFVTSVIWFSNTDSSVPLITHRPWESRPVGAPLPLKYSVSVKWGGWRAGGQEGLQEPSKGVQYLWDNSYLWGRAVCSASLAWVQASLLSTVGCISLRSFSVWGFSVLFSGLFLLALVSKPKISMNDYWGVYKE